MYKLVTRVLAAILKGVMQKLVHDTQTTPIKGKSIFEGWALASEVLDDMMRSEGGIVFKIDFEKVYDCVDWDFFSSIPHKMGFGKK